MSSNPLMMGYEGGDYCWLALPGQRSGRCRGLCAQAVGVAWVVGRLPLVTWQRITGGWCHKMRYTTYKSTSYLFSYLLFSVALADDLKQQKSFYKHERIR